MSDKKLTAKFDHVSICETAVGELLTLTQLLNASYGLQLCLPDLGCLKSVKQFCVGLLENPERHPWGTHHYKSPTVRWSVAASLFLFRKRIPCPPNPSFASQFAEKMVTKAPLPDLDFIQFSKSQIRSIFRKGWDRRYGDMVSSTTPPPSACYENSRSDGGCRAYIDRDNFIDYASGSKPTPYEGKVTVASIRDNGKDRIVTVAPANQLALDPLHKLLYNHLSRFPWLLRGSPTTKNLRPFTLVQDEVFVSGDYESATDNLSLELYEIILQEVLNTCDNVPQTVKDLAMKTVRSELYDSRGKFLGLQGIGQLMGNRLSFPFLCLTNYLAFKFAIPRNVPVLINGDDILFRCRKDEADNWFSQVGKAGLKTSPGKTLIDMKFMSINSTFFRAGSKRCRAVPYIRSKALFSRPDSLQALRGQFMSFAPSFGGRNRQELQVAFLKLHSKAIWRSNRSINRGLGMRVSWRVLTKAGFSAREKFYLGLDVKSDPPPPPCPGEINWVTLPEGWRRYAGLRTKERVAEEQVFWKHVYDKSWNGEFTAISNRWSRYWESVNCCKTFRFVPNRPKKWSRLTGMTLTRVLSLLRDQQLCPLPRRVKRPTFYWARVPGWKGGCREDGDPLGSTDQAPEVPDHANSAYGPYDFGRYAMAYQGLIAYEHDAYVEREQARYDDREAIRYYRRSDTFDGLGF